MRYRIAQGDLVRDVCTFGLTGGATLLPHGVRVASVPVTCVASMQNQALEGMSNSGAGVG
jgi:hypothetical protein